jgi:hypothetical protein
MHLATYSDHTRSSPQQHKRERDQHSRPGTTTVDAESNDGFHATITQDECTRLGE